MSRLAKLMAAAVMVPAVVFASPVHATVKSYIEGGDIFKVKNVTDNGSYVDPGNADACETVSYRVRLHNPGPDYVLNNITVQASVPQATMTKNVATIIVRSPEANPENTSDTATLNISTAQKLSYVNGSTQLLNSKGEVIKALPDGITGAGVNVGSVGISLNEIKYVRFEMKVSCPEQPKPTPQPAPQVKKEVTELPNTGAGSVISLFAGASALGAAGHYAFRRFRG